MNIKTDSQFAARHRKRNIVFFAIGCPTFLAIGAMLGMLGRNTIFVDSNTLSGVIFRLGVVADFTLLACMIGFMVWSVRRTHCSDCQQKLKINKRTPEIPTNYSAYCQKCNVQWDLMVNSEDPD